MAHALRRPLTDLLLVPSAADDAPRDAAQQAVDPDDALAARAARGDEQAFTELVGRCFDDCWRFARRMLDDDTDAEDAVQETFVRVHRAIARYEPRERFRAWLFRILANRCRTLATRRGARARRFVNDEHAIASAPARGDAGSALSDGALERALQRIDPLQREAFLLKFGEELEYDEMSDLLGVSVSALKMRVSRARIALRQLLAEER